MVEELMHARTHVHTHTHTHTQTLTYFQLVQQQPWVHCLPFCLELSEHEYNHQAYQHSAVWGYQTVCQQEMVPASSSRPSFLMLLYLSFPVLSSMSSNTKNSNIKLPNNAHSLLTLSPTLLSSLALAKVVMMRSCLTSAVARFFRSAFLCLGSRPSFLNATLCRISSPICMPRGVGRAGRRYVLGAARLGYSARAGSSWPRIFGGLVDVQIIIKAHQDELNKQTPHHIKKSYMEQKLLVVVSIVAGESVFN